MKKILWLMPSVLMLALILTGYTLVCAAAVFEVTDVIITPDEVKKGENVTISVMVKNTGDAPGTHKLELKINGQVAATQGVELDPGKSQKVSFAVAREEAGTYTVVVDGLSGEFTVKAPFLASLPSFLWAIFGFIAGAIATAIVLAIKPPASKAAKPARKAEKLAKPTPLPEPPKVQARVTPVAFTVSNLVITPNKIKEGESITISALVINTGAATGNYSVVLKIEGIVENIEKATLEPGASQKVAFTVTKAVAGDYYVEVDGVSGSFTVEPLIPATFVVSDLAISPNRVKEGVKVTITALVTNTGDVAGKYSVVLRIKGIVESIEEVSLGPRQRQKVSFNIAKDKAGFYQVAVDGLSDRFVVEMAD